MLPTVGILKLEGVKNINFLKPQVWENLGFQTLVKFEELNYLLFESFKIELITVLNVNLHEWKRSYFCAVLH